MECTRGTIKTLIIPPFIVSCLAAIVIHLEAVGKSFGDDNSFRTIFIYFGHLQIIVSGIFKFEILVNQEGESVSTLIHVEVGRLKADEVASTVDSQRVWATFYDIRHFRTLGVSDRCCVVSALVHRDAVVILHGVVDGDGRTSPQEGRSDGEFGRFQVCDDDEGNNIFCVCNRPIIAQTIA